ncbi:metallo-beta-lactamase domain-containing protein 1 [Menidia menidia]
MDAGARPPRCRRLCVAETELDFPGQTYSVSVLKVGYCIPQAGGSFRADGTITLITGPRTVLVDTGGPWDRDFLLRSLRDRGVQPGDVQLVVGTHGHSDHIGNLSLFPSSLTVVGYDVSEGDTYRPNGLAAGRPFRLDECLAVLPTPGHSGQDVSVQVRGTAAGTVLVAGDLFECCSDQDRWRDVSLDPALQEGHRQQALTTADLIIPGHGLPFRVVRD